MMQMTIRRQVVSSMPLDQRRQIHALRTWYAATARENADQNVSDRPTDVILKPTGSQCTWMMHDGVTWCSFWQHRPFEPNQNNLRFDWIENMHTKIGELWPCGLQVVWADRQTDRYTEKKTAILIAILRTSVGSKVTSIRCLLAASCYQCCDGHVVGRTNRPRRHILCCAIVQRRAVKILAVIWKNCIEVLRWPKMLEIFIVTSQNCHCVYDEPAAITPNCRPTRHMQRGSMIV